MTRIRFGEASPDGLSRAIGEAEIIAILDCNWDKVLWDWNKRPARSVAVGAPAHPVIPLEIAVNSPEELVQVKALVERIKEGPAPV